MHVLLIDDDAAFLRLAESVLRALGADVTCHHGPLGSLAATMRHKPDVVLLDINMPSLDGAWLLADLKRVSPRSRIYFCSDSEPGRLNRLSRAVGAHGVVTKSQFTEPGVPALRALLMGIGKSTS